ncbi:hypothetical protein FDECE_16376 [Fusarium decemcellulare]|nr:hypothetical protein FDECE_16376 [Fusarium decemcellulare]
MASRSPGRATTASVTMTELSPFQVTRDQRRTNGEIETLYQALKPDAEPKECMGYVRFKSPNDGKGFIEITNRLSNLQPWHLQLGAATKANKPELAGRHGDGLKHALAKSTTLNS